MLTTWQMDDAGRLIFPIVVLDGARAAAQILRNALRMDRGEYDLAPDAGTDPDIMRTKNPQPDLMRSEIRRVLGRFDFVESIEDIEIKINDDRTSGIEIGVIVDTEFGGIAL